MRTAAALIGLAFASPTHADVIFETTFDFAGASTDGTIDQFDDTIRFDWLVIDPLGSPNPADRIPILSLTFDNASTPGLSAAATSGPAFDAAAAAVTDDIVSPGLFFFATRTSFLLPDGSVGSSSDLLFPESLFMTDDLGNPVSLTGAQVDQLRVELVSADINPGALGPGTITANYQIKFQILGVIPTPATAAPLAAAALLTTRRRR